MTSKPSHHHYNPDWLSDEAVVANFVVRQDEFGFLRDELAHAPIEGSVQHYLLIGPRGAGKTTLLKRLAVSIRNDVDIRDHLIALSFPEELYQVKNLADFWWAACDALLDELERLGEVSKADQLLRSIESTDKRNQDPSGDVGLILLRQICVQLKRRPVMLVDNLDLVFQRIDKSGRKLNDPHAPAYWALREALSTTTSPIVIGGSVRLSEPFTDYDKAFYDFFLPKRLSKLSLAEVHRVLERLAYVQGTPEVLERLRIRPGRVDALYELTGGNPRSLGLIFELLRQGSSSRAVEDFERLMDITTPYFKARFEDLSEQAQVVMHALAVRTPGNGGDLRFGHTAAEIGNYSGLPTTTISAQMDVLEREGLVEKNSNHGRTQYRISEQLFRLWLQMRSTRRIRQNVLGLTEFLQALFDVEELYAGLGSDSSPLAAAKYALAIAETDGMDTWRCGLQAYSVENVAKHVEANDENIEDYLQANDLRDDLSVMVLMYDKLRRRCKGKLTTEELSAFIGSISLTIEQKQLHFEKLCLSEMQAEEFAKIRTILHKERQRLLKNGMHEADLAFLYKMRACGHLPLPFLTVADAEVALIGKSPDAKNVIFRLIGAREFVKFKDHDSANEWLKWSINNVKNATSQEWANVAGAMRCSKQIDIAMQVLDQAFKIGDSAPAWYERGVLLFIKEDFEQAEAAHYKAIDLDSAYSWPWTGLGRLLRDQGRTAEAEAAYRKAIELDPGHPRPWNGLGNLLRSQKRKDEAEAAYRKAIELDSFYCDPWNGLGNILREQQCMEEAESSYRKAIELDPFWATPWSNLGHLLRHVKRMPEAESAYQKAIKLDPFWAIPWNGLGSLFRHQGRTEEAEAAYRKAIELDSDWTMPRGNLASLLATQKRTIEAEAAYRKAIELDPTDSWLWNGLGNLLSDQERTAEAETAYRKAIELDSIGAIPWSNLGSLLRAQDRTREAEIAYRKAIELDPVWASPWNGLGNLLLDQNRTGEAEVAYRKAIELDSVGAIPWSNLGNLLRDKGLIAEAEAAYRKAIEFDPVWASPWNGLGNLFRDHKLTEEAEAAYRKAIELDQENYMPWYGLSRLYEQNDMFDQAIDCQEHAEKFGSKFTKFWRSRRDILLTKRNTRVALQALKENNDYVLGSALAQLLAAVSDKSAVLVSSTFVEDFLAPMLKDGHGEALLRALNEQRYDKYARPLLLAFKAVLENRPDKLSDIEPEIQKAATMIFDRLTGRK